jgi:hypothetical protein
MSFDAIKNENIISCEWEEKKNPEIKGAANEN